VSADTIVPNPGNPQDLNRYAYAANNPLRYTDPTGHISEDEVERALEIIDLLQRDYGVFIQVDWGWQPVPHPAPGEPGQIWIEGAWELAELETVLQAVGDLAGVMGGAERFRENLGGVRIARQQMRAGGRARAHRVWLNAGGFTKWTVVHELGHAWDAANSWRLSRGLEEFTGGRTVWEWRGWLPRRIYKFGGVPPKGADQRFNRLEDFAESVTTYVYPGEAQVFIQQHFPPDRFPDFQYENYYQTQRALYVAKQLNFDPQELRLWQKMW